MSVFERTRKGIRLFVRLQPRASRDQIDGSETHGSGRERLRVRVTALPDKGEANARLAAMVAKALGVSKTNVRLASGTTSRLKTLEITGDIDELVSRLGEFAGEDQ